MANNNSIVLDFSNAPPAGGRTQDKVPPGQYLLTVAKAAKGSASTGRDQIIVNFVVARGEYTGKKLVHRFPMPMKTDEEPVIFGVQMFHQMLLALGFQPPATGRFKFDLNSIIGRRCMVDVVDKESTSTKGVKYTNSDITEFLIPTASATSNGRSSAAVEEEEDLEDDLEENEVAEDDLEEEDLEEELEEEEEIPEVAPPPATRQRAAATATATAPAQQQRRGRRAAARVTPPAVADDNDDPFDN